MCIHAVSCLDTRSFNSISRAAFAPALVYIASVWALEHLKERLIIAK